MSVPYRYVGISNASAGALQDSIPTPPGAPLAVDVDDRVTVWYASALSAADETALDAWATGRGYTKVT